MSEPDDGFLSRWVRRKAEAKAEPSAAEPAPVPAEPELPPDQAEIDAYVAALPKLEDFTPLTDLRPFLHRLVPEALRLAAMRRLWSVDPMVRDFVNDAREYALDWNTPGGAPGYGPLETTQEMKDLVMRQFSRPAGAADEASGVGPDHRDDLDTLSQSGTEPGSSDERSDHAATQQESDDGRGAGAAPVAELPAGSSEWVLPHPDPSPPDSGAMQQAVPVRVRHGSALPR